MATAVSLDIVASVDSARARLGSLREGEHKAALGQFLTPPPVARLMASMFQEGPEEIRLLDPGAGIGTLTAAFIQQCFSWKQKPSRIRATLYEIDPKLRPYLEETVQTCREHCNRQGIDFDADIFIQDFIAAVQEELSEELFAAAVSIPRFNFAILNPPYRKIGADSPERNLFKSIGIETSNLYAGFLAAVIQLLDKDGEFVAITPRSFCNGPYFQPFRKLLFRECAISRIHVFTSRRDAFQEDGVLQENVILSGSKHASQTGVLITSSKGPNDDAITAHEIPFSEVVGPDDPQLFVYIPTDSTTRRLAAEFRKLACTLGEIGVSVSTGPVVDFRLKEHLLSDASPGSVPLLQPAHVKAGSIEWPRQSRKPNAILDNAATRQWLVPNDTYVLVKRFSSNEEKRRIVAAVYQGTLPYEKLGLENHLNFYHQRGHSLPVELARGLAAFLNSTLVDEYFRQFTGHTQVNAADLRNLRYPSREKLAEIGGRWLPEMNQAGTDALVADALESANMTGKPVEVIKRVREAEEVLKAIGLPKEQQNERSALTLLALLDLRPDEPWSVARSPLRGITPIMEFISEHYGKDYAPNTRETIRRFTVHQMVDAGLLRQNPDKPTRPINSPDWVYQVAAPALDLLQSTGAPEWAQKLTRYLKEVGSLKERYAKERDMTRIPIEVEPGKIIELSPGGQNTLVELILHEFAPRFTPGARLLYVGDTDEKFAHFDRAYLAELGVTIDVHGKMPDVILHFSKNNWLILVEAVTSHGPINPKRRGELLAVFRKSKAGLVFVTAFLDRKAFTKYAAEISWETEVWVAESVSHLIHFDGERFLGPYPD